MYKLKKTLIKSLIYPENKDENSGFNYATDNLLYRSLERLFETFYINSTPHRELYLVGGCVRDMLMGRTPKDYDLCTNATPDEVKQICDALHLKYFDSGIKHGTLTIIDDFYHQQYEITTYRIDGKYEDGRHPAEVIFTPSLEEDLKRRDFTINSFAYNLLTNEIVMLDKSYIEDLNLGIIKTVGNPVDRFNEDALRMLRAIRFSAQLGFIIDKDTYEAIKEVAPKMLYISKERIRDELTKILMSDNPQILELLATSGLEQYLFSYDEYTDMGWTPIQEMIECKQHNKYHYTDVFHHTMDVVKRLEKKPDLRWAAFLHDIGKPEDETTDEEGWCHYYKHVLKSADTAKDLMDILKFSNDSKDRIIKFIKNHDYPLSKVNDKKFKQKIVEIGEDDFNDFLKLREADAFAHNLSVSTGFALEASSITKERFKQFILEPKPIRIKDLAINGNDIKADGFLEGKEIGDCLNWMLDIVLEHPEYNTREKLLEYLQLFKEMSFQDS